MLVLEAINADRVESFGWALMSDIHLSNHSGTNTNPARQVQVVQANKDAGTKWIWAPSWHEFSTHLAFDMGFQASFILGIGCTVFYIAGIVSLPSLFVKLGNDDVKDLMYWWPLFVGGVLFVISGVLYVLETQGKWVSQ